MKRSELKVLIKECLVEILAEGLGPETVITESTVRRPASRPASSQSTVRSTGAPTTPPYTASMTRQPADVLTEIFADTAQTTFREQARNEIRRPTYVPTPYSSDEDASPAPASGPDRWAMLAFMDDPKTGGR